MLPALIAETLLQLAIRLLGHEQAKARMDKEYVRRARAEAEELEKAKFGSS